MKQKHFFAIIILVVLMAVLSACSSRGAGNEANAPSPTAAEENQTPEAAQGAHEESLTKIVNAPLGDVEIPQNPQRIVTDGYLPELLVLGLKPVGSTGFELENKVIQDQIEGIQSTGERSLEVILSLEPDLIVTWVSDMAILEQYQKIAPTLSVPYGYFNSIYETIGFLGDALNKKAEGEEWLAGLDQTAAEARAELEGIIEPESTFALMGVFVVDRGFYIYGDGGYRGGEAIYTHLKLTPPRKQQEEMIGKEQYRQISYEVVDEYAGDYIFIDQGAMISEVWGNNEGVWKSLDAVKNNRVMPLDPDLFWGNDPISLKLQIKEIVRMLKENASQA